MKLSSIMRYVTYESESDTVPLDQEISYLKSFIDLQQLRFGKEIITFDIKVEEHGKMLAPMLLIPLVENAIKHGSKYPDAPAIKVKLHANEHFEFSVTNAINTDLVNKDKTGGIGLKNLKRRLELIYPDSFSLECHTDFEKKQYFTRLWIK
jgi:sensor histidine kinase YesM